MLRWTSSCWWAKAALTDKLIRNFRTAIEVPDIHSEGSPKVPLPDPYGVIVDQIQNVNLVAWLIAQATPNNKGLQRKACNPLIFHGAQGRN